MLKVKKRDSLAQSGFVYTYYAAAPADMSMHEYARVDMWQAV